MRSSIKTASPTSFRGIVAATCLALVLAITMAIALPQPAQAASTGIIKAEKKAFDRSVKAILDYKKQPNSIVVDVSDLGLSYKQICKVYDLVAWDGRYFWINPFGEPPKTKKSITYTCLYTDKKIDKMRKKFDAQMKSAMAWAPAEMSKAERIHMLHDWLMKRGGKWTHDGVLEHKTAYGTFVQKKGDCQGFTLGMNALLNTAGFTVDAGYIKTDKDSHAWSRVKLDGVWYNIDATYDNTYTRDYPSMWQGGICQWYLLVNDRYMAKGHAMNWNDSGHPGFKTNYSPTNKKASHAKKYLNKKWYKTNRAWMKKGSTFTCQSFTFKVLSGHKAKLLKCNATSKKSLTIPKQAAYRGHAYKITAIDSSALKKSKATKLVVQAPTLTKGGVKNSLKGTKVTSVVVSEKTVSAAVYKKYQSYFAAANCGKSVKLSYA